MGEVSPAVANVSRWVMRRLRNLLYNLDLEYGYSLSQKIKNQNQNQNQNQNSIISRCKRESKIKKNANFTVSNIKQRENGRSSYKKSIPNTKTIVT